MLINLKTNRSCVIHLPLIVLIYSIVVPAACSAKRTKRKNTLLASTQKDTLGQVLPPSEVIPIRSTPVKITQANAPQNLTETTPNDLEQDIEAQDESLDYRLGSKENGFRKGHYSDIALQNRSEISPKIVYPRDASDDIEDKIEVNLEAADLQNVLDWISSTMHVSFLSDDNINPSGKYKAGGHSITFKTNTPLTKKKVWDLFLSWLDMVGLAVVPGSHTDFYKIVSTTDDKAPLYANRSPLPSYINVHWKDLPENDTRIRYVYLLENTTVAMLQDIIKSFRSNTGVFQPLQQQNGFIITDKAANVRSIMNIIEELDKVSMPEGLAVIKLKHADAEDVKKMYDALTEAEKKGSVAERLFGAKKTSTELYFPVDTRLIAEKRSNALIVLGTRDGIEKVERFIKTHIDKDIELPYSPLYVYELQYANAKDVAEILTKVTAYDRQSAAAQHGGVRDGDKIFKPMTFIAEQSGNRLLISADKEDYFYVREIIKKIDVKQPQIGVEVLVVEVNANDNKELGASLRSKRPGITGHSIDYQTSGLPRGSQLTSPIVDMSKNLVANLIGLAVGQQPGSTLVSLGTSGSDGTCGVWALFKILQTYAHTTILSQPFLITTNNYPATIQFGETRRVASATVQATASATSFQDYDANLQLDIVPLINEDGIINITATIQVNSFIGGTDDATAARNIQTLQTNANVGNTEILALGGLTRRDTDEQEARVPILGSLPLVGWFFKNKIKSHRKKNLLIFISPRIIEPRLGGGVGAYTDHKSELAKETLAQTHRPSDHRDPIHRWFFKDHIPEQAAVVDAFVDKGVSDECIDVRTSQMYKDRTTPIEKGCPEPRLKTKKANANAIKTSDILTARPDMSRKRSLVAFVPNDSKRVVT